MSFFILKWLWTSLLIRETKDRRHASRKAVSTTACLFYIMAVFSRRSDAVLPEVFALRLIFFQTAFDVFYGLCIGLEDRCTGERMSVRPWIRVWFSSLLRCFKPDRDVLDEKSCEPKQALSVECFGRKRGFVMDDWKNCLVERMAFCWFSYMDIQIGSQKRILFYFG